MSRDALVATGWLNHAAAVFLMVEAIGNTTGVRIARMQAVGDGGTDLRQGHRRITPFCVA